MMFRFSVLTCLVIFCSSIVAADVKLSQIQLNALGYNAGAADGIFGNKTLRAIEEFYQENNDTYDGHFDEVEQREIQQSFLTKFPKLKQTYLNPNETTSTYRRQKNLCLAYSTRNELPNQIYDAESIGSLPNFIDLYSDGKIDFIGGHPDEPKNEINIRKPIDYYVYIAGYKRPVAVKTLQARKFLPQDYNNDGLEDVWLITSGPHKLPSPGGIDTIIISDGNKYIHKNATSHRGITHGGTAGDFDKDGDIDVIAADGNNRSVYIYVNKGNASFVKKTLWPQNTFPDYPYTLNSWDVDRDGRLDVVYGTPKKIFVAYGQTSLTDVPEFEPLKEYTFKVLSDRLPMDFAFTQDREGNTFIVSLDTRLQPTPYRGFGINTFLVHKDREIEFIENIFDHDGSDYSGDYKNHRWLPSITLCNGTTINEVEVVAHLVGGNGKEFGLYKPRLEYPTMFVYKRQRQNLWDQTVYFRTGSGKFNATKRSDKRLCEFAERQFLIMNRQVNPSDYFWSSLKKRHPDYPSKEDILRQCANYLD